MSFFDLIPTPASAVHGTLAIWSVPNVRLVALERASDQAGVVLGKRKILDEIRQIER